MGFESELGNVEYSTLDVDRIGEHHNFLFGNFRVPMSDTLNPYIALHPKPYRLYQGQAKREHHAQRRFWEPGMSPVLCFFRGGWKSLDLLCKVSQYSDLVPKP